MSGKVAVIMSLYKADDLQFFQQSVDSILLQSYQDIDVYIYVDGFIPDILKVAVRKFEFISNVTIFWREQNCGLAFRLNQLIDNVILTDATYIARMDADDISHPSRIEKQVAFLNSNNNIDIVGTSVFEINQDGDFLSYKKMRTNDYELKAEIIKRCPFNHPTVMMHRRIFDDSNRYSSKLKNTQDYYLWIDLAKKGYIFSNIDEPLLNFRIDKDFHQRRGKSKAKNDFNAKRYAMKELDCHSIQNWFYAFAIYLLRISPSFVSKFAYNFFRNSKKINANSELARKYCFTSPH